MLTVHTRIDTKSELLKKKVVNIFSLFFLHCFLFTEFYKFVGRTFNPFGRHKWYFPGSHAQYEQVKDQ